MFARNTCKILKLHNIYNVTFVQNIGRTAQTKVIRPPPPVRLTFNRHNQHRGGSDSTYMPRVRVVWNKLFGKYLLATNIISSGVLMVVGDIAAQEIEYRRGNLDERYDFKRIGRMFIVGALQGPLHHYVYNWMDRIMPVANMRNTLQKILIDQIVMSPACILIFFYSACYLERKSFSETNDELIEKFPVIYLMDWLLWPGVQYINFRYLDIKYRVMFVNVCTALYNIFMSYMKHDFSKEQFSKLFS